MSSRLCSVLLTASFAIVITARPGAARGQVLVGNPFVSSYENWTDPAPGRGGAWRLSLLNPTLMENSDIVPAGNNPPAATNNGSFVPALFIQDAFTTPTAYDLSARMYSADDDGFGIVFGYRDVDNYFRVTLRAQANGNLGGTNGLSVQKVVNGAVTQINPAGAGPGIDVDNSFARIDGRLPYDVTVAVNGNNYSVSMAGVNGGTPLWTGSDTDLAPGKVGVHSWAQRIRTANHPWWGTEVESVTVSSGGNTLYNGRFDRTPVLWRALPMANSNGTRTNQAGAPIIGDDRGNFGADLRNPWVYQQTNGFEWATQVAPNVDFIGPAAVVDNPGSGSFADYEMRLRMGSRDDDGSGVLVRVQNDDTFYRIHFANQSITAANAWERAPRGLSVQKVRNGVWTELFRDNQDTPLFVPPTSPAGSDPATGLNMYDVAVRAVGNTLAVTVTDSVGTVYSYPLITDATDPLLTGTVGLTTWGNEHVYFTSYGGTPGPLLTFIPEPTAGVMVLAAATGCLATRNRRRGARRRRVPVP